MDHKILPTQKPKRSRLRRLTLAGVAPLATLALIAGTAPAANAADVGVIVNTKNGSNAKVRNAPSTGAGVVEVFRNGTRLPDAECRVRTADTSVWVKLARERYIRADLTGFDTRLPECDAPSIPVDLWAQCDRESLVSAADLVDRWLQGSGGATSSPMETESPKSCETMTPGSAKLLSGYKRMVKVVSNLSALPRAFLRDPLAKAWQTSRSSGERHRVIRAT